MEDKIMEEVKKHIQNWKDIRIAVTVIPKLGDITRENRRNSYGL
jgi:hypothetical protein